MQVIAGWDARSYGRSESSEGYVNVEDYEAGGDGAYKLGTSTSGLSDSIMNSYIMSVPNQTEPAIIKLSLGCRGNVVSNLIHLGSVNLEKLIHVECVKGESNESVVPGRVMACSPNLGIIIYAPNQHKMASAISHGKNF